MSTLNLLVLVGLAAATIGHISGFVTCKLLDRHIGRPHRHTWQPVGYSLGREHGRTPEVTLCYFAEIREACWCRRTRIRQIEGQWTFPELRAVYGEETSAPFDNPSGPHTTESTR